VKDAAPTIHHTASAAKADFKNALLGRAEARPSESYRTDSPSKETEEKSVRTAIDTDERGKV
jgi:hypothetical protein